MPDTHNFDSLVDKLIAAGPEQIDLTDHHHAEMVMEAANQILELDLSIKEISDKEQELIKNNSSDHTFILLILKLVRSRTLLLDIEHPLTVSVVFAVYKEHNRIRTKEEHPHGENFLVKKVEQLEWLFAKSPNISWKLIVVDDGCPENSGQIARQIAESEKIDDKVRVLFLSDAIEANLEPASSLSSTNESQKGGSIVYGMWDAVTQFGEENHIVVFTDADLSTHLGQTGLLLYPVLRKTKLSAIGSRRESDSVVIKTGSRNNRGKLFIYLWKRLLAILSNIVDTQCGFKAFTAELVPEIISDMIEKKFAFDIELLLRTELSEAGSIEKVGIAWIDSEAASTTTDLSPYLSMLKSIVKMYEKYLPADAESDEFADFIKELSDEEFNRLLDQIPSGIVEREPAEFADYKEVMVSELRASIV